MRLTFAGAGAAFCDPAENFQSNMVLTVDTADGPRRLLVDCGSDARFSLPRIGVRDATDLEGVYVSHLHADHVGGLEWLALTSRYSAAPRRVRLYVPQVIAGPIWSGSLAGGLLISAEGPLSLADYFEVCPLAEAGGAYGGGSFVWQGLEIALVPVAHITAETVQMRSFGLSLTLCGTRMYLSTDAKFDPELPSRLYATEADVLFHDCETGPRTGVHSNFADLCTLPAELRARMWLYHYNGGPLPDARAHGFRGFVQRGQTFDFAKPETLLPQDPAR